MANQKSTAKVPPIHIRPLHFLGNSLLAVAGFLLSIGKGEEESAIDHIQTLAGEQMIEDLREATEEKTVDVEIRGKLSMRILGQSEKDR